MKKFSTYLLVVFMMLFWVLRIVITLASQLGKSFMGIVPMNETFVIVKRKMIGSLLYLTIHAIYFGGDVTNKLNILARNETLTLAQSTEFMFSMIGIILPLAVLLDLLLDKNRKMNPKDEKTDWFYKNEQFDRKLDDRADKNNYRTM